MVQRILGLTRLPDVATVSRCLSSMDNESTRKMQCMISDRVLTRLKPLSLPRVTLGFDGSVLGTGRYAEGAAVGFNKVKKGQRSFTRYIAPLLKQVRFSMCCIGREMFTIRMAHSILSSTA